MIKSRLSVFMLLFIFSAGILLANLGTNSAAAAEEYNYYLPYYYSNSSNWSGVGLRNGSVEADASIDISVFNNSGELITTDSMTLPGQGQQAKAISGNGEGWMKVSSSQPLTGLCFFGNSSYYMADITLIDTLSSNLYVPHVAQSSIWDTKVLICNPNSSATTVTLTSVKCSGSVLSNSSYTINANGSGQFSLSDFEGSVEINSTQKVAAFALYTNLKNGGYCYAGISAVTPLTVIDTLEMYSLKIGNSWSYDAYEIDEHGTEIKDRSTTVTVSSLETIEGKSCYKLSETNLSVKDSTTHLCYDDNGVYLKFPEEHLPLKVHDRYVYSGKESSWKMSDHEGALTVYSHVRNGFVATSVYKGEALIIENTYVGRDGYSWSETIYLAQGIGLVKAINSDDDGNWFHYNKKLLSKNF